MSAGTIPKRKQKPWRCKAFDRENVLTKAWDTIPAPVKMPRCPKCDAVMKPRVNSKGNPFYGCPQYPDCNGTLSPYSGGSAAQPGTFYQNHHAGPKARFRS